MRITVARSIACLLVLLASGIYTVHPAQAQEGSGFQETFDDTNLPGWELSPQAVVVDGALQVQPGGFAVHFGEWSDFTLTIRVRLSGPGRAVIGYCNRDTGRYLLLVGDGEIVLDREANQARSSLGRIQYDIQRDTWVDLKVVVSGGEHQVYLNDELQLTGSDPELLPGGGIMLSVEREATALYDDLTLTPAAVSAPVDEQKPVEPVPDAQIPSTTGIETVSTSSSATPWDEFFASQASVLDLTTFLINLVLAVVCGYILGLVYTHWGSSLSNRRKFAANFVLMAVTTTFIILVVRSSVALSLGLVGALSIVRFRTAVKEPEELAYLFVAVGIGIGLGDNQRMITLLALSAIVAIIGLCRLFRRGEADVNLHLTVSSRGAGKVDLDPILQALQPHVSKVKLLRLDENKDSLEAGLLVEFARGSDLGKAKAALRAISPSLEITFMDNKGLW